jgi:hypothetical protein
LKRDVLKDLPPKMRQVIELPADGCENVVKSEILAFERKEDVLTTMRLRVELAKASESPEDYKQAVAALTKGIQVAFEELSRIRRETAIAKIPVVTEHVAAILSEGHKVLLFCHHKEVARQLAEAFPRENVVLTGDTSLKDRDAAVERFQKDDGIRLFIGTIGAAGVGLTLTASSYVVFAELDWVPGNVTQAEDRCILRGSVLYCPRMGITKIENIKVGDFVLTHEGRERKVTAIHSRGHRGLVTNIRYRRWYQPLRCTHDHKLLVRRKDDPRAATWVPAHSILPGDFLVMPRPVSGPPLKEITFKSEWRFYESARKTTCYLPKCTGKMVARNMCDPHYREWLQTPASQRKAHPPATNARYTRMPDTITVDTDLLYLFGWYLAEGFSSIATGKSRFISLSGHAKERPILERLGARLEKFGVKWNIYASKKAQAIELRAYGVELATWFRNWFGHMAANKSVPPELMALPPAQARVVLQGYTEGDGYERKKQVEWVSASSKLCYQMCLLAAKCGYSPTMRTIKLHEHFIGGYTVNGKPASKSLSLADERFIYEPVTEVTTSFVERKEERVYDLTVEDDHSFVVGFASVHNCHRIGQKDSVLIQHLVLEGSLDKRMADVLVEKQDVADRALDRESADELMVEPVTPDREKMATQGVSAKDVAKLADTLTTADIAAVHMGLRMLAGTHKNSGILEGETFRAVDAPLGQELARMKKLTPRLGALGKKFLARYRNSNLANVPEIQQLFTKEKP